MSKLSKFKHHITAKEAAELLSELINETVLTEDIHRLHKDGWLYAHYECSATLVKLKYEHTHLPSEEVDFCLCLGFDFPLSDIVVNNEHLSFALFDLEGNEYGIRDTDTNQYINRKNYKQLCTTEALFYPNEIYEIAALANNGLTVEQPRIKTIRNHSCCSTSEIYNFKPDSEKIFQSALTDDEKRPQNDPPSYVLAVAVLVEIMMNGGSRNHNQSSLISEVLDKYELRGLSRSNLEKMFSQAKRKLSEAQAAKS